MYEWMNEPQRTRRRKIAPPILRLFAGVLDARIDWNQVEASGSWHPRRTGIPARHRPENGQECPSYG